jgi:putative flippase GtrA
VIRTLWRREVALEGMRYFIAGGTSFFVDFGVYMGLIQFAGVHYLVAAPLGFALGMATIYTLCVRWVFTHRRVADARVEFAIFAAVGLAGMGLNQLIIWLGVEVAALSYAWAKIVSAGSMFVFNFCVRKLLLFSKA